MASVSVTSRPSGRRARLRCEHIFVCWLKRDIANIMCVNRRNIAMTASGLQTMWIDRQGLRWRQDIATRSTLL